MGTAEIVSNRRRRWGCLGFLGLVLIGIAFVPWGLGVAIKRGLVSGLEGQLDGIVELEAVHVGWTGKVELGGLRVTGRDGFQHLAVDQLSLDAEVGELIAGRVAGTLDLSGVALHLRQGEEGGWSIEDLLPARQPEAEKNPDPAGDGPRDETPVSFTVRLSDIELVLETPHGNWHQRLEGNLRGDSSTDELQIRGLRLNGDLAQGDIEGRLRGVWSREPVADPLSARLTYTPDKLAPLVRAYWPELAGLQIRGADPQAFEVELTGPLDLGSIEQQLKESQASGRLELGQLSMFGLNMGGDLALTSEQDGASFGAELGLDGGLIGVDGRARLYGAEPGARLGMTLSAIPVEGQISNILASVHPIFAAAAQTPAVDLAGFLDANLDLAWSGALPTDPPEAGWSVRDLAPLSLTGRIEFAQLQVGGVPFVNSMLSLLGGSQGSTWNPSPLEFHIDGGRLTYDKPWTWTLGDVETRFEGAVGLDGQLHLVWNVPVDEQLAARRSELAPFVGETLSVPLGGTLRSPKIDWNPALLALGQSLLKNELEQHGIDPGALESVLEGDLGGLTDLLEQSTGTAAGGEDPGTLLKEADRLWEAGDRTAAGKLYTRLRKEFSLSSAYLLNRKRVKRRKDG